MVLIIALQVGELKKDKRKKDHIRDAINNKHHSIHFQRAWNKYGEVNFKFDIFVRKIRLP